MSCNDEIPYSPIVSNARARQAHQARHQPQRSSPVPPPLRLPRPALNNNNPFTTATRKRKRATVSNHTQCTQPEQYGGFSEEEAIHSIGLTGYSSPPSSGQAGACRRRRMLPLIDIGSEEYRPMQSVARHGVADDDELEQRPFIVDDADIEEEKLLDEILYSERRRRRRPPVHRFNMLETAKSNLMDADPVYIGNIDFAPYIDDDLKYGRKRYLSLTDQIDFRDGGDDQYCASEWIRICIERYHGNRDVYHAYIVHLVQSLMKSIGEARTVSVLKQLELHQRHVHLLKSVLSKIAQQ